MAPTLLHVIFSNLQSSCCFFWWQKLFREFELNFCTTLGAWKLPLFKGNKSFAENILSCYAKEKRQVCLKLTQCQCKCLLGSQSAGTKLGEPKALSKECLISASTQTADAACDPGLCVTLMPLTDPHQSSLPAPSDLWCRDLPAGATSWCLI